MLLFAEIAIFQKKITDTKASVTSYVVASNPEVLAKLMRDANKRQYGSNQNASNSDFEKIPNPSGYTLPASSLNTITVDFASSKSQICSNQSSSLTKSIEGASTMVNIEKLCTESNSGRQCSNQSAFISNIDQIRPCADKANFSSSSNCFHQKSKITCSTTEGINDFSVRTTSKNDPVQLSNDTPSHMKKMIENGIYNKVCREQRMSNFSSLISSVNSSRVNHQNSDKVN